MYIRKSGKTFNCFDVRSGQIVGEVRADEDFVLTLFDTEMEEAKGGPFERFVKALVSPGNRIGEPRRYKSEKWGQKSVYFLRGDAPSAALLNAACAHSRELEGGRVQPFPLSVRQLAALHMVIVGKCADVNLEELRREKRLHLNSEGGFALRGLAALEFARCLFGLTPGGYVALKRGSEGLTGKELESCFIVKFNDGDTGKISLWIGAAGQDAWRLIGSKGRNVAHLGRILTTADIHPYVANTEVSRVDLPEINPTDLVQIAEAPEPSSFPIVPYDAGDEKEDAA